jgi:bifunctional non-homologous end joining protein LigD
MTQRTVLQTKSGPVDATSLDEVIYPVAGFRKGELLNYYVQISEHLLPHLRKRPIKLKLFWEGTMHPPRDERDAPPDFLPQWIDTAEISRAHEDADMEFALVNDLRSLLWLANHKNYEFHPFLAKASNLKNPTAVVFDLDPGHPADLLDAAQVAMHLKKILDALKLKSFVKSTGSKGLHVYVPLNTPTTYDKTASFARQIAEQLECAFPELVVSKMAKLVRAGKVFVDWSQNEYFKSTVAVYSIRAVSAYPFVAAPLTWKEVAAALKKKKPGSLHLMPDEVLKRVKKDGDLFAPLLTLKQKLPATIKDDAKQSSAASSPEERSVPFDPIEPMECKQLKQPKLPDPALYLFDVKHDGYRCIAMKQKDKVVLFSREGTVFNTAYPNIVAAVQMLRPDSFVIDGEIVAHDGKGRRARWEGQRVIHRSAKHRDLPRPAPLPHLRPALAQR